jgi:DNA-binding Xre family transcriptional regulator
MKQDLEITIEQAQKITLGQVENVTLATGVKLCR